MPTVWVNNFDIHIHYHSIPAPDMFCTRYLIQAEQPRTRPVTMYLVSNLSCLPEMYVCSDINETLAGIRGMLVEHECITIITLK